MKWSRLFAILFLFGLGISSIPFVAGALIEYSPAQTGSPPSRMHPGIQFDQTNERVVMFGGGTLFSVLGDTWTYTYSTNTWTQIFPTASPSARSGAATAYDPTRDCMILFGGWLGSSRGEDTWIFNCTTDEWSEVSPVISPSPRMSSNMVYDSTNDVVVLFSGYCDESVRPDETWVYDMSTNTWSEMSPATSPCGRYGHCMIYDSTGNRTILFSGNSPDGMTSDLWEYDYPTDTWTELFAYPQPLGRKWGSMVYDSDMNRGILFGGDCNDPEFIDDTWAFNCNTSDWDQFVLESKPEVRASPGLAYDSINELVVLFGGQGGGFGGDYYSFDDTWVFENNEWVDMSTMPSSSDTTSNGATPIEWIVLGISIPVIIGAVILVKMKRS
jgi:hypothetical protein